MTLKVSLSIKNGLPDFRLLSKSKLSIFCMFYKKVHPLKTFPLNYIAEKFKFSDKYNISLNNIEMSNNKLSKPKLDFSKIPISHLNSEKKHPCDYIRNYPMPFIRKRTPHFY